MRVSLITVAYNAERHLRHCIESVLAQDHPEIEYIIVDGASTDGTLSLIRSYGDAIAKVVSEPDQGIYDAMNKGIRLATGDLIGLINADDFYAHAQVISQVVAAFAEHKTDTIFGDLVFVEEGDLDKVVRYYPGKGFHHRKMRRGIMPPHPTFFARRGMYEQYGYFDEHYRICADFDLMLRWFYHHEVSYQHLPTIMVKMRTGGASTKGLHSTRLINREILHSLRKNGIPSNLPLIYSKYLTKIFQLVKKPV
jgi:glycosyltransferase involved in cell wall biosynthesis